MKKFDNYVSNLRVLERADKEMLDNEFIISGIIDKFCIQFELGWKLLKELLAYEGSAASATGFPRSIIKEAYSVYPLFDGERRICNWFPQEHYQRSLFRISPF